MSPARDSVLNYIRRNPGAHRSEIVEWACKGSNAIGRRLYSLHHMGLIRPVGQGKATRWLAVEAPVAIKPMPQYRDKPQSVTFTRVNSVFALAEAA